MSTHTDTPTFSVLMPAYNAAATIEPAIRSVFEQTRDDFELIVIDDGSTDETVEKVRPFTADPRVRIVSQENRGLAAARNSGIAAARGRFVSLLDSDDLWLPVYLERMGAALDDDPGAAMAYADAWLLDDATRRIGRLSALSYQNPPEPVPTDPHSFLMELIRRNFIFVSTTIRRSVLDEVGPFNAALRSSEDYELWLRLSARGYRIVRVPGLLTVYRRRGGQLSGNAIGMFDSLREVFRLVVEEYDVPDDARDAARERLRRIEAQRAVLSGERKVAAKVLRGRLVLGAVKRRYFSRLVWREAPPREVAAAFPDLDAV